MRGGVRRAAWSRTACPGVLFKRREYPILPFGRRRMETYLTPEEIAERLKVVPRTVYRWLTTGSLRGIKLGRIWRVAPTDLQRFLGSQSNDAAWQARFDAVVDR